MPLLLARVTVYAVAFAVVAFAQCAAFAGTSGGLTGRVIDERTLEPMAAATVEATSPSGSFRVTTGADGWFAFTSLPAGSYTILSQHKGYRNERVPGVPVLSDQSEYVPTIDMERSQS